MARKYMTKEVTKTTVKVAKMETENGLPKAVPLEDFSLIGNVSLEKAQRYANKHLEGSVTVFEVIPDTTTYRMKVEDFIKVAEVFEGNEEEEEQE